MTICETTEPPLAEAEPGHAIRCHIPLEELRRLQVARRSTVAGAGEYVAPRAPLERSSEIAGARRSRCAPWCCASRAGRSRSRPSRSRRPRRGEVLVRVAARRGLPLRPASRRRRPRRRSLADGARPRGRRRRRGGRARASRGLAPGDHVAFCFVRQLRGVRRLPRRAPDAVRARAARNRGRRHADGRQLAPARRPTATVLQHGLMVGVLRRVCGRARAPARSRFRRRSRCGRPRCSAAGSVTGIGAVNRAGRADRRERLRDRLRRRRAAGGRGGPAGRRGDDRRRRPRTLTSSSRARPARRHARDATRPDGGDVVDEVLAIDRRRRRACVRGGRHGRDDAPGLGVAAAGRDRRGRRAGAARSRGLAARDRVPVARRRSPAATTARPTCGPRSTGSRSSSSTGALTSARSCQRPDRARRGIEEALDRLRRGEGGRSVIVIDEHARGGGGVI